MADTYGVKVRLEIETSEDSLRKQLQSMLNRSVRANPLVLNKFTVQHDALNEALKTALKNKNPVIRLTNIQLGLEPHTIDELQQKLNNKGVTLHIKEIKADQAVNNLRSQLVKMLGGLQITGVKEFLGDTGRSDALKLATESAAAQEKALREASAAAANYNAQLKELKLTSSLLQNIGKQIGGINDTDSASRLLSMYSELNKKIAQLTTNREKLTDEEVTGVNQAVFALKALVNEQLRSEELAEQQTASITQLKTVLTSAGNALKGITSLKDTSAITSLTADYAVLMQRIEDAHAKGNALSAEELGNLAQSVAMLSQRVNLQKEAEKTAQQAAAAAERASTAEMNRLSTATSKAASLGKQILDIGGSSAFNELNGQYATLMAHIQEATDLGKSLSAEQVAAIEAEVHALREKIVAHNDASKASAQSAASETNRANKQLNLYKQIYAYTQNNTKAYRANKIELDKMMASLNGSTLPADELSSIQTKFKNITTGAQKAGLAGKSFFEIFEDGLKKFGGWSVVTKTLSYVQRIIANMITSVKELDAAMTELRKVTDLTEAGYAKFAATAAETAQRIGATLSDVITSTADFAKLGYSVNEAAQLAEAALVYKNIGDGIRNVSEATESIISTMQAFGYEAENAMQIVDKFNEVGNKFAISSSGIGEALKRSASALFSAGNTLEESIGMIAAMNEVIQDPDSVGTALKTLTMYLRAAKTEAEAAGVETDGMADSVSALREKIIALTGIDIMIDDDTFKSTYDILAEISSVWATLSDTTQANVLNLLGGKRNANVVSALLNNWKTAGEATKAAMNSLGSALNENETYLDSIAGKLATAQAAFESLSSAIVNSSIVKGTIDLGTGFMNMATGLARVNMLLPVMLISMRALSNIKSGYSAMNIFQQFTQIHSQTNDTQQAFDYLSDAVTKLTTKEKQLLTSIMLSKEALDRQKLSTLGLSTVTQGTASSLNGFRDALRRIGAGLLQVFDPVNLVLGGISVAIGLFTNELNKQREAAQAALETSQELYKSYTENVESYNKNISTLESLEEEYSVLSERIRENGDASSLTEEDYKRYLEIVQQIANISPDLVSAYNDEGDAIDVVSDALDIAISKQKEYLEQQRQIILGKGDTLFDNNKSNYESLIKDAQKEIFTAIDEAFLQGLNRKDVGKYGSALTQAFRAAGLELSAGKFIADGGIWSTNYSIGTMTLDYMQQLYKNQEAFMNALADSGAYTEKQWAQVTKSVYGFGDAMKAIQEFELPQIEYLMAYVQDKDWFGNLTPESLDEFRAGLVQINDPLKTYYENAAAAAEYGEQFAEVLTSNNASAVTELAKEISSGISEVTLDEFSANLDAWLSSLDLDDTVHEQIKAYFMGIATNTVEGAGAVDGAADAVTKSAVKLSDALTAISNVQSFRTSLSDGKTDILSILKQAQSMAEDMNEFMPAGDGTKYDWSFFIDPDSLSQGIEGIKGSEEAMRFYTDAMIDNFFASDEMQTKYKDLIADLKEFAYQEVQTAQATTSLTDALKSISTASDFLTDVQEGDSTIAMIEQAMAMAEELNKVRNLSGDAALDWTHFMESFTADGGIVWDTDKIRAYSDEVINLALANGELEATYPGITQWLQDFAAAEEEAAVETAGLAKALSHIDDTDKLLQTATAEMEKYGGLTSKTVQDISNALIDGENITDYLYVENGVLKLNTWMWENRGNKIRESDKQILEARKKELEAEKAILEAQLKQEASDEVELSDEEAKKAAEATRAQMKRLTAITFEISQITQEIELYDAGLIETGEYTEDLTNKTLTLADALNSISSVSEFRSALKSEDRDILSLIEQAQNMADDLNNLPDSKFNWSWINFTENGSLEGSLSDLQWSEAALRAYTDAMVDSYFTTSDATEESKAYAEQLKELAFQEAVATKEIVEFSTALQSIDASSNFLTNINSGEGDVLSMIESAMGMAQELNAARDLVGDAAVDWTYFVKSFTSDGGIVWDADKVRAYSDEILTLALVNTDLESTFPGIVEYLQNFAEAEREAIIQTTSLSDALSHFTSTADILLQAQKEMDGGNGLTISTIKDIAGALVDGEKLTDYLYVENNLVLLNAEAWEKRGKAVAESDKAVLNQRRADIEAQIQALEDEYNRRIGDGSVSSDDARWIDENIYAYRTLQITLNDVTGEIELYDAALGATDETTKEAIAHTTTLSDVLSSLNNASTFMSSLGAEDTDILSLIEQAQTMADELNNLDQYEGLDWTNFLMGFDPSKGLDSLQWNTDAVRAYTDAMVDQYMQTIGVTDANSELAKQLKEYAYRTAEAAQETYQLSSALGLVENVSGFLTDARDGGDMLDMIDRAMSIAKGYNEAFGLIGTDAAIDWSDLISGVSADGAILWNTEMIRTLSDETVALAFANDEVAAKYPELIQLIQAQAAAAAQAAVAEQSLYAATNTLYSNATSALSQTSAIADYTELTKSAYDELIALDARYAGAVEYQNGVLTLNKDRHAAITNELLNEAKAQAQANMLKTLTSDEYTTLVDKVGNLNDEEQARLDTLNAEIMGYSVLISELENATGAYQRFLRASTASDSDRYSAAESALKVIQDTLHNADSEIFGKIGREQYTAALDFLIDPDVEVNTAEFDVAMKTVERYLEEGASGVTNFYNDLVSHGFIGANGQLHASMQEMADSLGISMDFLRAMIDELNMYQTEENKITVNCDTSSVETEAKSAEEQLEALKANVETLNTALDIDHEIALDNSAALTAINTVSSTLSDLITQLNNLSGKTFTTTVQTKYTTTGFKPLFAGLANASGSRSAVGGPTLVGENGLEIVVDPKTNTWYAVGQHGAEFVNMPAGALVFNAQQSEQLLGAGRTRSRAKQYGTAMVTGNASLKTAAAGLDEPKKPGPISSMLGQIAGLFGGVADIVVDAADTVIDFGQKVVTSVNNGGLAQVTERADGSPQMPIGSTGTSGNTSGGGGGGSNDDNTFEDLKNKYDDLFSYLDHRIKHFQHEYNVAENGLDFPGMEHALSGQLEIYREIMSTAQAGINEMIAAGAQDTDAELQALEETYWEAYDNMYSILEEMNALYVDALNNKIDDLQSAHGTLTQVVSELNSGAGLTLDTFQELANSGLNYLSCLEKIDGQYVVNEEAVRNLLAAEKEQLAIEQALAYINQLTIALRDQDEEKIANLVNLSNQVSDATWGQVYAQAALLQSMGLTDEQYQVVISNIEKMHDLANAVNTDMSPAVEDDGTLDDIANQYDDIFSNLEHRLRHFQHDFNVAEIGLDFSGMESSLSAQANIYKEIMDTAQKAIQEMIAAGAQDTDAELQAMEETYWEAYNNMHDIFTQMNALYIDGLNNKIDGLQSAHDTLTQVITELNSEAGLTLDTFQELVNSGLNYLSCLEKIDGQYVVNEEAVRNLLAAEKEQLAIEQALSYINQLKIALQDQDAEKVANLVNLTNQISDATWGQVYAQAALLQSLGLTDEEYQAVIANIEKMRELSGSVNLEMKVNTDDVNSSLNSQGDAILQIIEYTKDLIRYETEQQISAIEDQIDAYQKIVDLKKESLKAAKEERRYADSVTEKTTDIATIQARIDQLALDDSREARAERVALQEDLAALQKELRYEQEDHAYEMQIDALDRQAADYAESRQAEITALKNSISSAEKLQQMAIERLKEQWETILPKILQWNSDIGNSLNVDIIEQWNLACQAVQKYGSIVEAVAALTKENFEESGAIDTSAPGSVDLSEVLPQFHSGGTVGSKHNEVAALLEKGETVLTSAQSGSIYRLVNFSQEIAKKFGTAVSSLAAPVMSLLPSLKDIGTAAQSAVETNESFVFSPNIEVHIDALATDSAVSAKEYGKQVASSALKELQSAFSRRGMNFSPSAILKA